MVSFYFASCVKGTTSSNQCVIMRLTWNKHLEVRETERKASRILTLQTQLGLKSLEIKWDVFQDGFPNLFIDNVKGVAGKDGERGVSVLLLVIIFWKIVFLKLGFLSSLLFSVIPGLLSQPSSDIRAACNSLCSSQVHS